MNTKNNKATIHGADARLISILKEMAVSSYETREHSKYGKCLYVRFKPLVQPIQLAVVK